MEEDPWLDRFEVVTYRRVSTLADILFPRRVPTQTMLRQIGERLNLPADAEFFSSTGFMTRLEADRLLYPRDAAYAKILKRQLSWLDFRRLKILNLNLDTAVLADVWTDFVDFERRSQTEIPFLLEQLAEFDKPKVLDACLGSGATSIGLKLAGIEDVVSNEIDGDFVRVAEMEARKHGVNLDVREYNWMDFGREYRGQFDAVTCTGNSITYLFKRREQLRALRNFKDSLKQGRKLIIDERNYDDHFLNGKYRYSGEIVYCGKDKVDAHPIHISDSMVVMGYHHLETGQKAHLVLYPFKRGELRVLLEEAGFRDIEVFGDYKRDFKPEDSEFITYVCRK